MAKRAIKTPKSSIQTISMTGFGRGSASAVSREITVEVRSVNHRYLEASCRLPPEVAEFESEIRDEIREKVQRGKVELFVRSEREGSQTTPSILFNKDTFKTLLEIHKKAYQLAGDSDPLIPEIVASVLRYEEVLKISKNEEKVSTGALQKPLMKALDVALTKLVEMRSREGVHIGSDIAERIAKLDSYRKVLEENAKKLVSGIRERIISKIREGAPSMALTENDPRVAMEVVIQSDRGDVTEELVRLKSHLTEFQQGLSKPHQGRRLEFVLQEISREFSTLGAKIQNGELQRVVVDAKVELEKIREQLQNVA